MKKIREKTGKNGPKTSMERYSSFWRTFRKNGENESVKRQ
jgi:hypothetical protein